MITFYGFRKENISTTSTYSTSKKADKTTEAVFEGNTKFNKNNTTDSTTSIIPDTTTYYVVSLEYSSSGNSKINKNYTTDFTPSRIPDTTIGTGSPDHSSDQNASNTLGFETSTSVTIVIATIAVYLY